MTRLARDCVVAVFIAGCVLPATGCGKNEAKPNPDMQIPDIPPGGKDTKGTPGGNPKDTKQQPK